MQLNEFLAILQLILLTVIFASTLIIALMVYDMYRITKFSKTKARKEAEASVAQQVKCSKCNTPMQLTYDGTVVDGYVCPKCKHTEITSKKS